jgi:hypothetical protein
VRGARAQVRRAGPCGGVLALKPDLGEKAPTKTGDPMVGQTAAKTSPGAGAKPAKQNLQSLLDEIAGLVKQEEGTANGVTFRELMASIGRRSYGPVLLAIGLFSISPATVVPGMTWLSAGLTLIIALQMAVGLKRPWLPKAALDAQVSAELLKKGVAGFRPWARRIDAVLKPRLTFLAAAPFVNLVALLCAAAAIITIPLGLIPFAPLAPGAAIVLFGLGMTARDGLVLLLGSAAVGGALYLAWSIAF